MSFTKSTLAAGGSISSSSSKNISKTVFVWFWNICFKSTLAAGASILSDSVQKHIQNSICLIFKYFDQVDTGRRRVNLEQFRSKTNPNSMCLIFESVWPKVGLWPPTLSAPREKRLRLKNLYSPFLGFALCSPRFSSSFHLIKTQLLQGIDGRIKAFEKSIEDMKIQLLKPWTLERPWTRKRVRINGM